MQEVQKKLLLKFREETALPIKDCKAALVSCNWNWDAAVKSVSHRMVKLSDQWCTSANPWGKTVPKFQAPDDKGRRLTYGGER